MQNDNLRGAVAAPRIAVGAVRADHAIRKGGSDMQDVEYLASSAEAVVVVDV